jgi:hypothetical protein
MKDPIEPEDPEVLVELVFVPIVLRDLDQRVYEIRRVGTGRHIVP